MEQARVRGLFAFVNCIINNKNTKRLEKLVLVSFLIKKTSSKGIECTAKRDTFFTE